MLSRSPWRAGPAGLTAALALRRLNLEVAVLEQAEDFQRIGEGIVLHDNGQRVLEALGLLEGFRPHLQPCGRPPAAVRPGNDSAATGRPAAWVQYEPAMLRVGWNRQTVAVLGALALVLVLLGGAVQWVLVRQRPADGWNGYRYWMAFTPFPDDIRENPSIVASQDGVEWREPDSIRNLVVPMEEIRRAGYVYDSDPELVLTPDGWMLLYYRPFLGEGNEAIYCKRSRNGIDWSDGQRVLSNLRIRYPAGLISPAVEVDLDGGLMMWTVNGLHLGRRVIERRTSPDGVSWSAPERCVIPHHVDPWHLDVAAASGRYHMLVTDGTRLFHWQSEDGRAWRGSRAKAIGRSGTATDARGHYRSTLVPLESVPLRWDVWATGESGTGRNAFCDTWRIGLLHDIDLNSGAEDEAPPGLVRSWQRRWQRLRGRSFERVLVAGALLRSAIERWAAGGSTFRKEGDL